MRPNFIRERKLFHTAPTVVTWHAADWLVGIGAQKTEDRTPQFSGIPLQVIKEINAEPVWIDITFPSRHDRAGIRTQEEPSPEQIPINFVDIPYVKRFDLVVMHFHGQVRPHSLNRIAGQENHFQLWEISDDLPNNLVTERRVVGRNITGK